MRQRLTLTLAVLMGFSSLAWAGAQSAADSSCRNVTSLTGVVQSMCANSAQWAEFDSRMAQLDQGFSCRPVKASQPLCLFAKQWKKLDRDKTLRYGTPNNALRDEAQRSAMAISNNDYATIRQGMIDSLATTGGTPIP